MPQTTDFRNGVIAITKLAIDLADQIPTPILLIDGRAGSGKSSFAAELRNEIFKQSDAAPVLIHMDDLYPGWEGLRAGSNYLNLNVLEKLKAGKPATWQLWDWSSNQRGRADEPGNGWREFAGGNILIVEGCGSLSRNSKELASLCIWIDAANDVRRKRWEQRDNHAFDSFWGVWQAQEDEFYQAEKSEQLTDLIVKN